MDTAKEVEGLGKQAIVVQADFASEADCGRLVNEAWDKLSGDGQACLDGGPQVWINNAGADVLTGQASELSFGEKLQRLFQVDVASTINISRMVRSKMFDDAEQNVCDRSMVFIGWDQAPLGMEGDAGQMFGPVKSAVMAFAASFAQDVAPTIRVNTVCPGWIKTAWGDSTNDYWDHRAKTQALMGRWGRPSDIAQAVNYLTDPENTFCVGQSINVNGGWSRRFPGRPS